MADLRPEKLAALNEFWESEARANYYLSAPDAFIKEYRLEVRRIGLLWVMMVPGLDWAFFNRILGLGIGEPATETMLEDAIGLLQAAGCWNYMAPVGPLARPGQIPDWLVARGFACRGRWAKVYRGAAPVQLPPCSLRVERIGKEYADAFADVVLTVFAMPEGIRTLINGHVGRPEWLHYLAFDGGRPVAAAAMYMSGGVGWLGFGSTLASHRKRGAQSALLAQRINDGAARGCTWFVTETEEDSLQAPNPSYHNMLRAGFKFAYLRDNYIHETAAKV